MPSLFKKRINSLAVVLSFEKYLYMLQRYRKFRRKMACFEKYFSYLCHMNTYMSQFPLQTQRKFIRFLKRLNVYAAFVQNFHKDTKQHYLPMWQLSNTKKPLVSAFEWENSSEGFDFWNYIWFLWGDGNSRILNKDINHIRTEKHNLLTIYRQAK